MTFTSNLSNIKVSKEPIYIKGNIPSGHSIKADSDGFFIDGGSVDITSKAWSLLNSDVYNSELIPNSWYLINEPFNRSSINDSGNILLRASSTNTFSMEAFYEAFVPDYTNNPLWIITTTETTVTWDGKTWEYVSGLKNEQPGTGSVWNQIVNPILEWDDILYDFKHDVITKRSDRRNNVISQSVQTSQNPISTFQWGNNNFYSNVINDSYVEVLNSPAILFAFNTIIKNSTFGYNTYGSNVSITYNYLDQSRIATNDFLDNCEIAGNKLYDSSNIFENQIVFLYHNYLEGTSVIAYNSNCYLDSNNLNLSSSINNNLFTPGGTMIIGSNSLLNNCNIDNNTLDGTYSVISGNILFDNGKIIHNTIIGSIFQNILFNGGIIDNCTLNSGYITGNSFNISGSIENKTLNSRNIDRCTFNTGFSLTETIDSNLSLKIFTTENTIVEQIIDITGLTSIDITDYTYVDNFILTSSNSTETLIQIVAFNNKRFTISPDYGLTLTITGVPITPDPDWREIVLKGSAESVVLSGDNGDWIEFNNFYNYNGNREINRGIYSIDSSEGFDYTLPFDLD